MNRSRLLGAVRSHLMAMTPEARDYSGHFLLRSPVADDNTCPNCLAQISKSFDIPATEYIERIVRCAYCRTCETFTVWPVA